MICKLKSCVYLVGDIRVLQERVHAQHGVVRFHHRGGNLRARPHGERNLGLLTVVDRQAFEHQATKTGSGTTTDRVVNEKTLETSTVVREFADAVQTQVDDLLANGVVATSEVVSGILLAGDQLLWVEELTVGTRAHLIDDGRFQIDEDRARHVLARTGLGKEGVESIIAAANGFVRRHLTIRLNTMLEAEKLPAGVTDLDTGLTDMNADSLTHDESATTSEEELCQ